MLRCFKFKRSVSPVISVLKCDIRQFHVSSTIYVRKVLRRENFSSEESIYESVEPGNLKNDIHCFEPQNSSTDFLGIESDTGVITLGPPQNKQLHSATKSELREKFHKTAFGVIRYDADNKLRRHAQYQKKTDFTFPYENKDYASVSNNLAKLPDRHLKTLSVNEEVNKNFESYPVKKIEFVENCIDEHYFGNILEKENINNNNEHPLSEELDFIDKEYFETLTSSKNFKSPENDTFESENISDIQRSSKLNFLNKNNLETAERERKEISIERERFNNDNSSHSASQEMSFFDENYFEDFIPVIEKSLNTQNITWDNQANSDSTDYKKKEMSELSNIEGLHTNNIVEDQKIAAESNHILHEYMDYNKPSLDFLPNKKKEESSIESMKINQCEEISNKDGNPKLMQALSDEFTMSDSLDQTSKAKVNSKQKRQTENNTAQAVQSVNESELKISSNEEADSIPTAHDFVKKLRKQSEIPQQSINKGKDSTGEEKFDSKGFRILKNQVADLTHYTRDEIFSLLKQNIVYSDDDLLILNKPYGLVIHESRTTKYPSLSTFLDDLARDLDKKGTDPKLLTVHRIDKETTGCLLLARNETMAQYLKALLAQRKIIKRYWIVTSRVPDPPAGVIDIPITEGLVDHRRRMVLHAKLPKDIDYRNHSDRGREAITSYEVIAESGNAALVEVFPQTGLKHQIRVHFGFGLSCPIIGDHKYSHLDKLAPQKLPSDILQKLKVRQSKVRYIPMHIHAKSVTIPQYFEDRDLFVNTPIPEHMKINMKRLKFKKK